MFQFSELILLGLLVSGWLYWWSAAGIKEIALEAAKGHCRDADVQLLDQCIVLDRFWFRRDEIGKIRVWRSFIFEFASTGEIRYKGRVILLGRQILAIQLDPYRV